MKRNVVFGTVLSLALAGTLSAQSGSAGSSSSQQTPSSSTQQQVTVTGCLQTSNMAGATGTSGTATGSATGSSSSATGASSPQFVLTKAKMGSGASAMSGGTSGTGTSGSATGSSASGSAASGTGAAASAASGDKYILVAGTQQENLTKYANSQVEIRGRIVPGGSGATDPSSAASGAGSAAGSATGSSASGTGSQSSSTSDAKTLQVSSVRQLSSTCSSN